MEEELDVTKPLPVATPQNEDVTPEPEETDDEAQQQDADAEGDEPETTDESEEVEYKGNKYKVPKTLAELVAKADNLDRDYTQGKQALAERDRAIEADREALALDREFHQAVINDLGQLASVESQLAQYQNVNWQAWRAANPQEAQAARDHFQDLKDAHSGLSQRLEQKRVEIDDKRRSASAESRAQIVRDLMRPDPRYGWSGKYTTETDVELANFARNELGWGEARIKAINSAQQVKELHLQRVGFEAVNKLAKTLTKPKAQATPVPQVGMNRSRATVDPDRLSDTEWLAMRNKQLSKRGRG
jgi:hypothetical protein